MDWLKNNGCPFNTKTFSIMVDKSDIVKIKWLFKNGCPYDKKECLKYANNNIIKKWIEENL
jgi:hypothetical protein